MHPALRQKAWRYIEHHQRRKYGDIHRWRGDDPPQSTLHKHKLFMQNFVLLDRLLFGFRMVDE